MTLSPSPRLADLLDLGGRTAIVTGGAMGIGLGIVRRLHEAGANVVVADVDDAAAQEAVDALGDRACAVHADVAVETDIPPMIAAAVDTFGGLDILVNNAGIYPVVPFLEMERTLLERLVAINLLGPFSAMQAAARQMIAQGRGGAIVNVTSIDALHPSMSGLAAYDASKHGLWGLTKNVALELADHGIAVNALAPGAVATPGVGVVDEVALEATTSRIPVHRMADADEMGRVVVFLVSGLASYVVGSQVVADGGLLLR